MHDSHIHLSQTPLIERDEQLLKSFKENGGKYLLNVAYNMENIELVISQYHDFKDKFAGLHLIAIGIHPTQLNDSKDPMEKAKELGEYIENKIAENIGNLSAVGEIGLDYFHILQDSAIDPKQAELVMEAQRYLFRKQLEIAIKHNLPITVHTRDINDRTLSVEDALKLVAEVGKGRIRGSFHSFTGDSKLIKDITDLGLYVGFNGISTYNSGDNVRESLRNTPIERILIETDGPYLPPQKARKTRSYSEPEDVKEIMELVIEETGVTEEQLDRNFEALFLPN